MHWTGVGCKFKDGEKTSSFRVTVRLLWAGGLYTGHLGWSQGQESRGWVGK